MLQGISFLDISRLGMSSYTAEMQIDLGTKEPGAVWFLENVFLEENTFLVPEDNSHQERAMRAVVAAKAERDTILLSFAPERPIEIGDTISDTATYGGWVPEPL
jgi:hypothetical protein